MASTAQSWASYLNGFDWLLIVLLAWSMLAGFKRGIARALLGLLGMVGGCLLATEYNLPVGRTLATWIQPFATARIVAFLLIASVVWVLFTLVGGTMKEKLKKLGLGVIDRTLGALFGLGRGLLLGVAVMLGISASTPDSPLLVKSRIAPYFLDAAPKVSFLIPTDLQSLIRVRGNHPD